MLEINEVKIKRVLNPTSIDLGDYVVNPYMGCEYGCCYCYVKSNKVVNKRGKSWGTYIDVRMNASDLLEKEIITTKPNVVLLGSTTECFQPVEKEYKITRKLLEILNKHRVYYVILTRSPYIVEYIPLLKQGFCKKIYFTVNNFGHKLKQVLEPKGPSFVSRNSAIQVLLDAGLSVIPYCSPLIPWVTDIKGIFLAFEKAERIEFECLNFRLKNIYEIIENISHAVPYLKEKLNVMLHEKSVFEQTWSEIEMQTEGYAKQAKKEFRLYKHSFGEFFRNVYSLLTTDGIEK